jgi:hypothetical protein
MCILPKPRVTVRLVLGRRDYLNIMMVETPEIKSVLPCASLLDVRFSLPAVMNCGIFVFYFSKKG